MKLHSQTDFTPSHWLWAWIPSFFGPKNTEEAQCRSTFFCSALCAYIYTKLGFLESSQEWTEVRPKDWGTEKFNESRLKWNVKEEGLVHLIPEEPIL